MRVRSFVPAYHRLAEDLRGQIENGAYKPGDMISSEAQLAAQYGVSRMTVRRGISLLTEAGYLDPVQGKGCFVATPRTERMIIDLSRDGLPGESFTAKLLQMDVVTADSEAAGKLNVGVEKKILHIARLLSNTAGPVILEDRYLPYLKGKPLVEKEIQYAAFPELVARHTDILAVKSTLAVSVSVLSAAEAQLLDATPGAMAMRIEQVLYAAGDRPLGWSRMACRGDRYVFTAASHRYEERL